MGYKIEVGWEIREILSSGYGMKTSLRDRNAFSLIGGMRDSFEIDSGRRDLNSKVGWNGIKILKVAGWRDEAKTSDGMRDLKSLFWTLQLWLYPN